MNRRDFLTKAAQATVGATGLILLNSTSAKTLLNEGETLLTQEDIKEEGKIITTQDYMDEVVDTARFGDNLAEIILNAQGPITIERDDSRGFPLFRVYGETGASAEFKQHGKYKLALANKHNRW